MCRMPPLTLDPQISCFLLEASIDRLLHRGVPQQTSKLFVFLLHINDVVIYNPSASGPKYVLDEPASESVYVTFGGGDSCTLEVGLRAE